MLRRSLARHADTVTSGPTRPPEQLDDDILAGHRDRHWRRGTWWPVAAAVAAVLAAIGIVVAVRHATSHHSRPATPVTITRTACMTSLPKAWHDAINAGALPDSLGHELLGIGPDGEVLAPRVGPTDTDQTELVLIRRDGSIQPIEQVALSNIYRSTAFDILSFQTVAIDQRWIVVPMMSLGVHPQDITVRLDLIDRSNVHNKREIPVGTDPDKIALFDNHVYWVDGDNGKATSSVQDYDIAAGATRQVTTKAKYLAASKYGVAWVDAHDRSHVIAGQDPAVVPHHAGTQPYLVTDGANYAWSTSTGIGWYSKVTKQTVYVHESAAVKAGHAVAAVVGPYVLEFVSRNHDMRVIDTRTSSAAKLPEVGRVISSGGVVAFDTPKPSRVHLEALPGLHC